MRRSTNSVSIGTLDGAIYANLGFDFCSEHEHGIGGIRAELNCFDETIDGLDRYVAKNVITHGDKKNLSFTIRKKTTTLDKRVVLIGGKEMLYADRYIKNDLSKYENGRIVALWDEGSFLVSAPDDTPEAAIIKEIYEALKSGDGAIFLGGRSIMGNAGLTLTKASSVNSKIRHGMAKTNRNERNLKKISNKIGIVEKVKTEFNKKFKNTNYYYGPFIALSPKWISADFKRESGTKYPVMYWLNPSDQNNNNYGWYVVEDLEKWITYRTADDNTNLDPGPIPKVKKDSK